MYSCGHIIHAQGSRKGGKSVFSPPPPKVWKFFPPCLEVFPPLLFSPLFQFFDHFSLYYPPFWNIEKSFPPSAEGDRNFFEIFSKFSHFFKFFHKNSIFLRLPPQKKLKKFSPRKNFPPQFTVSKWFSYPHLWFHQEGFSSPLKNFNNFSPGENLSPPFGPLLVHVCPELYFFITFFLDIQLGYWLIMMTFDI